ncbi:MAG: RHS repeat-associated core domain-containing protein [Acidobacteriota bacterium]
MLRISKRSYARRMLMTATVLIAACLRVMAQDVSQYDHGTPPQHAAGVSPIGSYMSADLGTVNLSNGSLNFSLPIGAVGGRGFWLPLTLNYRNKVWSALTGSTPVFDPTPHTESIAYAVYDDPAQAEDIYYKLGPGWTVGAAPYIRVRGVGVSPHQNPSTGCTDFTWVLVKLTVVLPDKGEIELRDDQLDGAPVNAQPFGPFGCRTQDGYRGKRWHAADGSGLVFFSDNDNGVVNGDVAGRLITADGTVYRFVNANFGNSSGSAYLKNLGRCTSATDRNGNVIQISYPTATRVQYTDQLGRITTLDVNDPALAPYVLQVTLPGYNGQSRIYKVKADTMNLHYRAGINPTLPVISGDWDPLGYGYGWPGAHTSLFALSYGSGAARIDNQPVITQLLLPDNRSLSFSYNEFGEVAEVQMPTGGKVQYDHQSVLLNSVAGTGLPTGNSLGCEVHPIGQQVTSNVSAIDRAVVARRTYPDGVTLEGSWSYSFKIDKTEVQCRNASNTLLLDQWHYYMSAQRFLVCIKGSPDGTGYSIWSTGLERRNEKRASNGTTVLSANEKDWTQRAQVVWPTGAGAYSTQQIANDNRVNDERKYLDDGSFAKVHTSYDPTIAATNHINNPSELDEYDFDQTLKRYTIISYKIGGHYTGTGVNTINLLSLPLQQSVYDGGTGAEMSRTEYEYDNFVAGDGNHLALVDYGTVTGHNSNYGTANTERGSQTQIKRMVNASTFTFSYPRYDTLGNVVSIKDPRGNVATISYQDDFGVGAAPGSGGSGAFGATFSLPTLITSPPPNPGEPQQTARSQYDFNTGLLTGFKDRNGVVTQSLYNDPFDRPTQIMVALGLGVENHTAMYYAGLNPLTVFGVTLINNDVLTAKDQVGIDDGNLRSWTKTDGFGRTTDAFARDPQGDVRTTASYDGLGRATRVTNPYRTTSDPTYGYTDSTYDMLGRVTRIETFSGSGVSTGAVTTAFSGNQVTVTDQALKMRRSVTDGLGRLKQVIEDPNVLAYSTTYGYDALDDLTAVTQGVQTRTFVYDSLKRLKQAINPESGTINYTYDPNSNLQTKQDARLIMTTYAYDALNRVKSRTYTGDPQSTSAVSYKYDAQSLPTGYPAAFNRGFSTGRLVAATYGTSTSSAGNYTGYDQLGRATSSFQQTDSQNYAFGYVYNIASEMSSETYPSGRVVQMEYDEAARLAGVKNQATGLYWAGATASDTVNRIQYASHGAVSAMKLGNGKWEHSSFNSRLQPLQIGLGTSATNSSTLQLDYGYGTTNTNNGNVGTQTITIGAAVISQSYGYDALNRLSTATESGAWSQTYDCDRYGNRAIRNTSYIPSPILTPQSTTPTDLSAFNQGNNRIALAGFGYDSAGNVTSDPTTAANAMLYDAENRQISYTKAGVTTSYSYDGDGRRVKKVDSTPGTIIFVYNAGGQLIAEYHSDPVPPPTGGGGTSYLTSDHLGSTRVVTKSDGTVKARYDYMPFGEELASGIGQRTTGLGYSGADSTKQKFTQKERDSESGLDYFLARYYSSAQGRFTSSDPLLSSGTVYDPQTWNRYSYTLNNPLKYIDPLGLYVWGAALGGNVNDVELRQRAGSDRNALRDANRIIGRRNDFRNALTSAAAARDALPGGADRDSASQSITAYGAEGAANGVTVTQGNLPTGEAARTTVDSFPFDAVTNSMSASVTVTIDDNTRGNNLTDSVAHEGRHVADAQAFGAALSADIPWGGANAIAEPLNQTRYDREVRGYIVTSAIARGLGLPNLSVGGNEIWNSGWLNADRRTLSAQGIRSRNEGINNLLRTSPTYGLTPADPGSRYIPR